MRATAPALILTSFAALAQLVPACSRKSSSENTPGNDASSDGQSSGGSSSGGGLGDDGAALDVIVLGDGSSGGGGTCALPAGTFAVTATPDAEADPQCMPWSSTVIFPPSTKPNEAGVSYSYTAMGSLPVCAVSFSCQGYDDAGMLATTTGYIDVDGTSIAGTEEIQTPGDETVTTCSYKLSYVKQ
jgi:hypothetical protein